MARPSSASARAGSTAAAGSAPRAAGTVPAGTRQPSDAGTRAEAGTLAGPTSSAAGRRGPRSRIPANTRSPAAAAPLAIAPRPGGPDPSLGRWPRFPPDRQPTQRPRRPSFAIASSYDPPVSSVVPPATLNAGSRHDCLSLPLTRGAGALFTGPRGNPAALDPPAARGYHRSGTMSRNSGARTLE